MNATAKLYLVYSIPIVLLILGGILGWILNRKQTRP